MCCDKVLTLVDGMKSSLFVGTVWSTGMASLKQQDIGRNRAELTAVLAHKTLL